ncbi:MAG: 16S rRNA (adenine(1518)-N(6)/adenine(1519)-N(6))-dimethyltransferase RsmA [Candidatus Saccharibacteria bacterium]
MTLPNKQLGQHWLNDKNSLLAIVDSANVKTGDVVLEIGPGLGSLTQLLIDSGAVVWAIELDETLSSMLANRISDPNKKLKVIQQDILKFDFSQLPTNYKIVANIPYYLTSHLLRILSETINPPKKAVLLVQKEVAKRVCAIPGDMSLLSVSVQMYFEVNLGNIVPSNLFIPPPKVDSQILILSRLKDPLFGNQDPKDVFRIVRAGFSERRKKIRSSLSGGLHITKDQADELLSEAKIDVNFRAQNLNLSDWLVLTKTWQTFKV